MPYSNTVVDNMNVASGVSLFSGHTSDVGSATWSKISGLDLIGVAAGNRVRQTSTGWSSQASTAFRSSYVAGEDIQITVIHPWMTNYSNANEIYIFAHSDSGMTFGYIFYIYYFTGSGAGAQFSILRKNSINPGTTIVGPTTFYPFLGGPSDFESPTTVFSVSPSGDNYILGYSYTDSLGTPINGTFTDNNARKFYGPSGSANNNLAGGYFGFVIDGRESPNDTNGGIKIDYVALSEPSYTIYSETGSTTQNSSISTLTDTYQIGFSENGSMVNTIDISGVDTYGTGYGEFSTLNESVVISGLDGFGFTYEEFSTINITSYIHQGFAQGGLALLWQTIAPPSDTYASATSYNEIGSLVDNILISGSDQYNAFNDSGSLNETAIISGIDAFYGTNNIYSEYGSVNDHIQFSGSDTFPYFDSSTLYIGNTVSGTDTFGNHLFMVMSPTILVSPKFDPKLVSKDFIKNINIKSRLRHNIYKVSLTTKVPTQVKMAKTAYRRTPQKTHKTRV